MKQHACTLSLLSALATTSVGSAQLPDWSSVDAPSTATVSLEQSWCLVQEGNLLRAYSCVNRRWTTLQTRWTPAVRILNDAFVVQDGNVFYGWSPRTGRFATQYTWSPSASLAPQPTPQTWLAVVSDDRYLHVFQALDGVWTTFPLAGTPTVTMGTYCAIVDDGRDLYGVSAFYGTPVRLCDAAGTPSVVGAFGNSGIVTSTNLVHGFSAYRNEWATMPAGPAVNVRSGNVQAAFVALEEPNRVSFFSGHTGSFTSVTTVGALPIVELERAVAIVDDFPQVFGYSALTGTSMRLVAAAPPAILKQQWFALVDDGSGVFAFSANHGSFCPPIAGTIQDVTTKAENAVFQPLGATLPQLVYSQYRNAWTPLPPLPNGLSSWHQTAASVVLVEPQGGLHGLSVRGDRWVAQPTPPIDAVHLGTSRPSLEMTLVARAGLDLWAFNPRVQAWRHLRTAAPATTFMGNNSALVLQDGINAYGFSAWNDRWATQSLGGAVTASSVQVQAAYLRTDSRLHVYSGMGQLVTSHDYPEYWRAPTRGARMRIDLAGESDALAALLLGIAPTELPIPGLGVLRVDPSLAFLAATPRLPADGLFGMPLQIPDDPALRGIPLCFQAAIVTATGAYLTNAVDHAIL